MVAIYSANMRRLPDFLVVGPPRTATSWLDKALRGHVGLPVHTKETLFFFRHYERGVDWYADHFPECPDDRPMGEVCAAYFGHPEAMERIFTHMPGCRIVCTLRDPVDRLYSDYKLRRRNGMTDLPFHDAVKARKQMIAHSRYATLLEAWRARFGANRVLAVINDDLYVDPQGYVDQVTDFIGAGRITLPRKLLKPGAKNTHVTAPRSAALARQGRRLRSWLGANRFYRLRGMLKDVGFWRLCSEGGAPYGPLDPAVRARLQTILTPEIDRLEQMLGRDLSAWKRT